MSDDVELMISDEENAYYMREVKKTLAAGQKTMSFEEASAFLKNRQKEKLPYRLKRIEQSHEAMGHKISA